MLLDTTLLVLLYMHCGRVLVVAAPRVVQPPAAIDEKAKAFAICSGHTGVRRKLARSVAMQSGHLYVPAYARGYKSNRLGLGLLVPLRFFVCFSRFSPTCLGCSWMLGWCFDSHPPRRIRTFVDVLFR